MTTTSTTVCDRCGKDLSQTTRRLDYRLTLSSEGIPSVGGIVIREDKEPPISRSLHFCGMDCLRRWAKASDAYAVAIDPEAKATSYASCPWGPDEKADATDRPTEQDRDSDRTLYAYLRKFGGVYRWNK